MTGEGRPQKTPMFEALHAVRYHRQELFQQIEKLSGARLIAYVSGPDAFIERADTAYFNDLLYSVSVNTSIDLLLHTPGGDIDAALGPIDPQVTMIDESGNRTTQSIQAYLDAYEDLSRRLKEAPEDIAVRSLFSKLEPDRIVHFEAVKARARLFAENQLRRSMCRENGNFTSIAERLLDKTKWPSHGQVINADEAKRIGITVEHLAANDPMWDACWRLYCLQRLAVKPGQKLFESDYASLIVDAPQ